MAISFIPTDATIDDHVDAVLASPAACRRILSALSEMKDAGSLSDSHWNSVAATLDRIGRDNGRGRRLR